MFVSFGTSRSPDHSSVSDAGLEDLKWSAPSWVSEPARGLPSLCPSCLMLVLLAGPFSGGLRGGDVSLWERRFLVSRRTKAQRQAGGGASVLTAVCHLGSGSFHCIGGRGLGSLKGPGGFYSTPLCSLRSRTRAVATGTDTTQSVMSPDAPTPSGPRDRAARRREKGAPGGPTPP